MALPIQDALFLEAEARETPMHVGGMQLLRPPDGAPSTWAGDRYREMLEHREVHPLMARRPRRTAMVGPWEWEVDDDVDLEYHVRHSALPAPGRYRELLTLIGRLHGTLLDRRRPLWETHVIEGLADGQVAIYTKVHHALVDGVSAMKMLERSLSTDPDARGVAPFWDPVNHRRRRRRPDDADEDGLQLPGPLARLNGVAQLGKDTVEGALDAVRTVTGASRSTLRSTIRAVREETAAFPFKAPSSPLNVPVSGARRFAADSWSLERLGRLREATGATLNDVLLAMSSGALRSYLQEIGGLPDQPLIAMVPVSLRDEDDDSMRNVVGIVLCDLGTHLADPDARLERVRSSMEQAKRTLEGLSPAAAMLVSALSFAPLGVGPLFRFDQFRRPPLNLVISNVPGPKQSLYLDGALLLGDYPLSIVLHGQAMNITVATVEGEMCVGIVGDRRALPSLQRLLDHLEDALTDLEHAAGIE